MKGFETFSEQNNWGHWEAKGPVAVPDGCYWVDPHRQEYAGLSEVGSLPSGNRLMKAEDAQPLAYAHLCYCWILVRNGEAFFIGHWGQQPGFLQDADSAK